MLFRLFCCLVLCTQVYAEEVLETSLSIYSSANPSNFSPQNLVSQGRGTYVPGFGIVRETRQIELEQGPTRFKLNDLAKLIIPSTIIFEDLSHPKTYVVEQNFNFNKLNPANLLEGYINRDVVINATSLSPISGKLVSHEHGKIVIETGEGFMIFESAPKTISLRSIPDTVNALPTIDWSIESSAEGSRKVLTSYQTSGLSWTADYNLLLNHNQSKATLSTWVNLLNMSGKSYKEAKITLISGKANRIEAKSARAYAIGAMQESADVSDFQNSKVFEYDSYNLDRTTDLPNNSNKQLVLFPSKKNLKVKKELIYTAYPSLSSHDVYYDKPKINSTFPYDSNKRIDVFIDLDNTQFNGLGFSLPKGRFRIYQENQLTNHLEFLGEDVIDHVAANEKILVKVGEANDLSVEHKQSNFRLDSSKKWMLESFEIKIRNNKEKPQRVILREKMLRWSDWKVTDINNEFEKIDSETIHIPVIVPGNKERAFRYSVRYRW